MSTADSQRKSFPPAEHGLPFNPAVHAGGLIFLSGQIGSRPGTAEVVPGGVGAETRQALENIGALLETLGVGFDDVAKCTVLLTNMDGYAAMNQVYRDFFRGAPPARTAYGVSVLPFGAQVEIECIVAMRRR